jgi:hypothetical protein
MRGTQINRLTEMVDDIHTRYYHGYRRTTLPLIHHHLTKDGDDGMTTDVSGASETMTLWAPANYLFVVDRTLAYVEDTGQFNADKYGAITTGLENGIDLRIVGASGATEIFSFGSLSHLVQHNGDWAKYGDIVEKSNFNTGANWLRASVHWGTPIPLNGDKGEGLQFIVNDDFTDLTEHEFLSKGHVLSTDPEVNGEVAVWSF